MILLGDCLERLRELPENSVDACVTDPPYGLTQSKGAKGGFMGKQWDANVPSVDIWREVFRVLKPGGHLLSFGGTRTYHRMVCAIEDAGFDIRDQIQWLYGSGFPKSLDISKAIDKAAGAEREVIGKGRQYADEGGAIDRRWEGGTTNQNILITAPATDAAKEWQGWGTALKPANEPIVLARKPLSEKTVALNVLRWGVGGLNIDISRIEANGENISYGATKDKAPDPNCYGKYNLRSGDGAHTQGRWPANLLLDEEAAALLDEQSGQLHLRGNKKPTTLGGGMYGHGTFEGVGLSESGHTGASRFFYCAKASKSERSHGLDGSQGERNAHPT